MDFYNLILTFVSLIQMRIPPIVARFKQANFAFMLEENLKEMQGTRSNSPIISSISSIAVDLPKSFENRSIVLVSDLIEHSDLISMYDSNWRKELVHAQRRLSAKRPMLNGITLEVLFILGQTNPQQDTALRDWWWQFIEESGGRISRFTPRVWLRKAFLEDTESFVDTRSDRLDHWLFLIIFLVGAIPAFLVRYFFEFSAYLTSGWLLAVMGTYYYLIINTRRFRLREDKSADNLYFLGFLFTVSALIISLLKFSQNTGTEAQVANNPLVVVEDLGIGLTTTLFGLLLRVFISQQRRDPEEIEEEVRLTLADVSDRVQGDVIATGEMIEGARLLTAQILEESTEALRAQQDLSKEAMKEFRKSLTLLQRGSPHLPRKYVTD